MPTATWGTGQTSAAAGGGGYGTGTYQTTNNSYSSPTAGAFLAVWVFGLTNNAGTLTGGSCVTTVGSGTNPTTAGTFLQHSAGWLSATATGWCPFVTLFYVTSIPTCTNLRFTMDATDSIYQWFIIWTEYTNMDTTNPFGRWGSDTANADTADNESTELDQNTGFGNVAATSHVAGVLIADGSGGAVANGSGWTERYEGPSGGGQTIAQVQDDQDPTDNTIEWGAVTNQVFSWITLAVEFRDAGTVTPPRYRRRPNHGLWVPHTAKRAI